MNNMEVPDSQAWYKLDNMHRLFMLLADYVQEKTSSSPVHDAKITLKRDSFVIMYTLNTLTSFLGWNCYTLFRHSHSGFYHNI